MHTNTPIREGNTWLFPDGTTLPVVSGADGPEPGSEGAAGAEGAEGTTPPAGSEPDPFENTAVETFDRSYVEKLRNEAAAHRTKAKSYEQAFEGWDEGDQQVWLETVQLARLDPKAGAERLRQITELLAGGATPQEAADQVDGKEPEYLTKEEVDRLLQERDEKAHIDAQVQKIAAKAESLGYEKDSPSYTQLLVLARDVYKGDLDKAHEAIKAERQKVIDDYLAEKAAAADAHIPLRRGGAPASEIKDIKDFKDSRASLESRLAQMGGRA